MDHEITRGAQLNRRRLLVVTCGAAFGWSVHRHALTATAKREGSGWPEPSCAPNGKEARKILVAYATRYGSTASVAEAVGEVLCRLGHEVDVRLAKNVRDVSSYQAAIIGSAIYAGKWMNEATELVKAQQQALARVPAAYFVVCLTMKDQTPQARAKALAYLDPVRKAIPTVQPAAVGLFAGVVNFNTMSFMHRSMLKAMGAPEGDFRNLAAVKAWSSEVGPALAAPRRP